MREPKKLLGLTRLQNDVIKLVKDNQLKRKEEMNNKTYDRLKFIALIALPAVATFWSVVAPLWGIPYVDVTVTTLLAVDTLLGALLGISSAQYNQK